MWNRKEQEPPKPVNPATPSPTYTAIPAKEVRPVETPKTFIDRSSEAAHIGKSVVIKGELSGSEDLMLDGEVEGTIDLQKNALTIGPNGRIRAHVGAREIIVHGKLDGNIRGTE